MSTDLKLFDQLKASISMFVSPTMSLVVTDIASGKHAIEAVKAVKEYIAQVEVTRKELVNPLNARVDLINSYAKDIKEPLLKAETHIKAQLVAWESAQEKLREQKLKEERERQRKAEEEAAKVRLEAERELAEKRKMELAAANEAADLFGTDQQAELKAIEERHAQEAAEADAVAEREAKIREAEAKTRASDIEATRIKGTKKEWKCEAIDLSLVPREFLIIQLNESAVKAAARGGHTTIPGVRVWQETGIAITRHTSVKTLEEQKFKP